MQRHLHCTYLSLQSRLEMVAYIALGQTDTHTNRHRHMLERVSLPFESVCWNQRWNQRYDNLATKPRRQCSALWAVLRVPWFTGHSDIPPIALKHTYTYIHIHTHSCKLPHTRDKPTHDVWSESLFSLLPLQKPESLWRTFSFTLVETFEKEKNLSNNCYRKIKT